MLAIGLEPTKVEIQKMIADDDDVSGNIEHKRFRR